MIPRMKDQPITWNRMKSLAQAGIVSRMRITAHHAGGTRSIHRGSMAAGFLCCSTSAIYRVAPRRPCGRKASTAAMMRKVNTTE